MSKRRSESDPPDTPSPEFKRPASATANSTTSIKTPPQRIATPTTFGPTPRTARRYGLTTDDSNLVRKKVDTFGNLVMLVQQMILLHGGRVTEDSEFGKLLANAAKEIEDLKKNLFSSLTDEHYCMMVSHGAFTQTGELLVDPRYLPQVYDDFFGGMLDLFLSFSARSSEQGCRVIINVYVNYALQYASKHYEKTHVAAFYEVPITHPDLPGVGPTSGTLDYMIAKVDGNKDPKKNKWLVPTQPYLTVVEAKKSSTLTQNAQAQLVAQVLTLDYYEHSSKLASRSPRVGVLTDSFTWTFYYFVPQEGTDIGGDMYQSSEFVALDARSQGEILAILTLLTAGVEPKVASESVTSSPFILNRLI